MFGFSKNERANISDPEKEGDVGVELSAFFVQNASARTKLGETTATRAFQRVATTPSRAIARKQIKIPSFVDKTAFGT
ncbi:hypothetical protein HNQ49_004058 [Parapusillimonas granuli]|nr:hypothetical protein [Parapusillimonas granuli]